MALGAVIPVLRMFDEGKAREFYVDFLGFQVDWEHRFEPGLPLYLQLSRGTCVLHLSGHHGDACPGAAARIACDDLDAYHAELQAKRYGPARDRGHALGHARPADHRSVRQPADLHHHPAAGTGPGGTD